MFLGGASGLLLVTNALTCLTCLLLLHSYSSLHEELLLLQSADKAGGRLQHGQPSTRLTDAELTQVDTTRPQVFVVTPTYTRSTQLGDITRMGQTLESAYHVHGHRIHWIVVEDSNRKTEPIIHLLDRIQVPHTHLAIKGRKIHKTFKAGLNRNAAIRFLVDHDPPVHPDGVVYFADDDNSYDVRLFGELAKIKQIGVLPVAYSGGRRVEFPIIEDGKVVAFEAYMRSRPFPLDMAAFAISMKLFQNPENPLLFQPNAPMTTGETLFLESTGLEWSDLEPLADECTKVLVWHLKTKTPNVKKPRYHSDDHIVEA